MLKLRVKVLRDDTAKAAARIEDQLGRVVEKLTLDGQANMQQNVVTMKAVDTGNLLNSIVGRMVGPVSGLIESGAEYSAFVNYGTVHMAARPFADHTAAWLSTQAGVVGAAIIEG